MKIAGRYFNPSCLKIFQKSLRALFHSPLHLLIVQGIKFILQACQEALIKYYPDEFNKFELVLDRDDFITEANINLGLTVAEQRVVELDKVLYMRNISFVFIVIIAVKLSVCTVL